ncbi:phage tail tape measure C-terminal domain-containing protein [Burkholderia sp. 22PA0099]|uniref:phage tail tape measure C-terminal domain-containing protein n=1 Tax=Burkholderia sp. 22PA0099 TaxID=3237372 RepID=UPI0039C2E701
MANENITRVTADATGYTSELERAARSAQAFAESNEAAAKRVEAAQNAVAEAAANGSEASARSVTSFINSLSRQADAAGKSTTELLRQRAAALGVSDAAESMIQHIESVARANLDAAAAVKAKVASDRDAAAQAASVAAANERAAAETQRFIDSVVKEAATLGMSRTELLQIEAAQRGVTTATADAIAKIQAHATAMADAATAAKAKAVADREAAAEAANLAAANDRAAADAQRFINAVSKEAATLGMTRTELLQLEAAQHGVTAETSAAISKIEEHAKASADAAAAARTQAAAERDAAAEAARIAAASEKAAADTQRFVDAVTKEAASLGKTRAELLALEAAQRGVSAETATAIQKIEDHAKATEEASKHTHKFSLESNASRRELLVLAHEMSQGNFKQFGGSMLVLAEQSNATALIFNKTALSIGAFIGILAIAAHATYAAAEALAEYGETIEKIAKTTGLSTSSIQQFGFAAGVVGVSTKDASSALKDLEKAQNEAIHGNHDAAAAFKALGISQAELKSSSPDEILLKVADAFASAKDGAGKAAVANQLFGASGAELIPLLDRGSDGLAKLSQDAQDAGAVLGSDTVAQLAAFKEQLNESHEKMAAVSLSAKTVLIPTILNLNDALTGNVAMKPLLIDFYSSVGVIMKLAASTVATVVIGFEQLSEVIATALTVVGYGMTGEFKLAAGIAEVGFSNLMKQGAGYKDFMSRLWSDTTKGSESSDGFDLGHSSGWGKKSINFASGQNSKKPDESATDNALKGLKGQLDAREKLLKDSIDHIKSLQQQGVIDAQSAIQQEHDARAAAYADELKLVGQEIDLASRKKQKAALIEYQSKRAAIQQAILANDRQAADAQAELQQKELKAAQAYTLALDNELQQRADAIQAASAGRSLGSIAQDELSRITAVGKEGAQKYTDLVKSLTENKISTNQFDAEVSALQHYQAQRIALEQDATDKIKAMNADWSGGAVKSLNDYADTAANKFQQVGSLVGDLTKGMEDAFTTFVTTGKLSFSSLATSIIADIVRIQARALVAQAATGASSWLSSLFSVGTSLAGGLGMGSSSSLAVSSGSYYTPSSPIMFHADGGEIRGPGTGTSDSILSWVSNGEGILTAATMRRIGGAATLDALNNGASINGLARFANGGTVGSSAGVSPVSQGNTNVQVSVNANGGNGSSFDQADAKWLQSQVQKLVDSRLAQKMKGQGGYAYQMKYGSVNG